MRRVWGFIREHPLIVVIVLLFVAYQVFGDELPSINLEQALEDISDSLGKWTYVVVGALAFLETGAFVGLVFPGETAVVLAGAIAGNGTTSIVVTIAVVWVSAWLGDTASFYIGRRLGKDFILQHGSRVRITPERFAQVEDYFGRYGGRTILIGRFIGIVRALAPFIAGSSGMTYRGFAPYSILGTGLWAAAFSLLGYVLAENIERAEDLASRGIFIFGGTIAILVGGYLAIRYMRVAENRSKLARRLEETRPGAWVAELGRRMEPQARFFWHRLTPGELGLEFTTIMAFVAVSLFIVIGFGIVVSGDPGPTPGDTAAFDVVDKLRSGWLDDIAEAVTRLGSGYLHRRCGSGRGDCPRDEEDVARADRHHGGCSAHPPRGPDPEGDRRAPAPAGSDRERRWVFVAERPRRVRDDLRLDRFPHGGAREHQQGVGDGPGLDWACGVRRGGALARLPARALPLRCGLRSGFGSGCVRDLLGYRASRRALPRQ